MLTESGNTTAQRPGGTALGAARPPGDPPSRSALRRRRLGLVPAGVVLVGTGLCIATLTGSESVLAAAGPEITVDAASGVHAISPYIYGMAYASSSVTSALRIPIQRWGGDATTRYNWEQDSTNSGADWYFMSGSGTADPVPSAGPDALESQAQSIGGTTLMTIPIISEINNSSAWNCSFPTPPYPQQTAYNPYVTLDGGSVRCGNGVDAATGKTLTDDDIASNNTANSPAFEAQWVHHLVSRFGDAAHGGVAVYEMDNEPSGWDNTHRDVHPGPTGWDELIGDTEEYAAAVKQADPTAAIDGPGDFGWAAYVDAGAPGDNRASHGGTIWEAQYYLQQMAAYQQQHGVRLLDYFDEHYYPTTPSNVDDCIALCEEGDAETQAARLESTRSLWDPSYVEDDWIGQWYGATDLIPRMQSWVNQYYPGTKIAISEYNFGALDSLNGALTEADVLGIFGQENVGLASLWSPPSLGQPGAFSFAMYRNYDGDGDGFGDTSVSATSADRDEISAYAATRSSDGALTVMVINKTAQALTSPVSIGGFAAAGTAQEWTYDASDLSQIVRQPDATVSGGSMTVSFPASSITLLVIPRASSTTPSSTTTTPPSTTTPTSTTGPSSSPTTTRPTTTTGPTSSPTTTKPSPSNSSSSTTSTRPAGPGSSSTSSTVAPSRGANPPAASTTTTSPPVVTTVARRSPDRHGHHAGTGSSAASLQVRGVSPDRLVRGARAVRVEISGSGFRSGVRLRVTGKGVHLSGLRVQGGSTIVGEVSVSATASRGEHAVVATLGGTVTRCRRCIDVLARTRHPAVRHPAVRHPARQPARTAGPAGLDRRSG